MEQHVENGNYHEHLYDNDIDDDDDIVCSRNFLLHKPKNNIAQSLSLIKSFTEFN